MKSYIEEKVVSVIMGLATIGFAVLAIALILWVAWLVAGE